MRDTHIDPSPPKKYRLHRQKAASCQINKKTKIGSTRASLLRFHHLPPPSSPPRLFELSAYTHKELPYNCLSLFLAFTLALVLSFFLCLFLSFSLSLSLARALSLARSLSLSPAIPFSIAIPISLAYIYEMHL